MQSTDLDAQMNPGGGGASTRGDSSPKSIWARNWPRAFILFSLIVVVLTFIGIIMNFIAIIITPSATLLNIYCLIFSLLAFSAELRQFRWFRKISYVWMKYVYFLTYYKPRAVFYVFLGLLLLGDLAILYVAGAISIAVGVVMFLTSFFCVLPHYEDPQEQRREREEARRYFEAADAKPPGLFPFHFGGKGGHGAGRGGAENDAAAGEGNATSLYEPPVLPLQETTKPAPSGAATGHAGRASDTSSSINTANQSGNNNNNTTGSRTVGAGAGAAAFAAKKVDFAAVSDAAFSNPNSPARDGRGGAQRAAPWPEAREEEGGEVREGEDAGAALFAKSGSSSLVAPQDPPTTVEVQRRSVLGSSDDDDANAAGRNSRHSSAVEKTLYGESQLRRDFAAAMEDDPVSLR